MTFTDFMIWFCVGIFLAGSFYAFVEMGIAEDKLRDALKQAEREYKIKKFKQLTNKKAA